MFDFHAVPEAFSQQAFEQSLRSRWLGRQLITFPTIDSTNSECLRLPDRKAAHGLVIVAEEQTSGHGRFNRPWIAPPGKALLFSLILRGEAFLKVESALTIAAAVGLHRVITAFHAKDCEIRWPNDLIIRGRKFCGILAERGSWPQPGWVLGVGINVNQHEEDLPAEWRETVTSIAIESKTLYARELLLAQLCAELETVFEELAFDAGGPERIQQEWESASCFIGRSITVDTGYEKVAGMVVGLEPTGALILREPSGFLRAILSGSVVKQ